MISLRRSQERLHIRRGLAHHDQTFGAFLAHERYRQRFHALIGLDEERLPPGADTFRRAARAAEVVTYVLEGAVSHDALTPAPLVAGEFQCWQVRRNGHYHINASRTELAHSFHISLRLPAGDGQPHAQQQRFPTGERRDSLRIVASPDGRDGSLRILSDALIYSTTLQLGQHIAHELAPARGVWLHLVSGEARIGSVVLKTGDGCGVTNERVLSLTATAPTELLLIDLATRAAKGDAQYRLMARAMRSRSNASDSGELGSDYAGDDLGSPAKPIGGTS